MCTRACCLVLLTILAGCDTPAPTPAPPPQKAAQRVVEVEGVTPLLPDRPTHVAPTEAGQVFWVQEADGRERETVFALADGGLPGATRFSNASVLQTLGEPDGRGHLQSLVAGPDGNVYFFFAGDTKRKLLLALGYFEPTTGETRVLADAASLRDVSGMGNTIALARGSVVRSGGRLWLWLRHDHGYVLLSTDATGGPARPLRRPFERAWGAADAPQLVSSGDDLTAGGGGGLIYTDRKAGRLWRIDGTGEASVLGSIADLPRGVTPPSADAKGRLAMFAPDGPTFAEAADAPPVAEWPGWVVWDGDKRTVLGRGAFSAPERLNVRRLALRQLFRDRSSWLGYDGPTGELLRVRVVEK